MDVRIAVLCLFALTLCTQNACLPACNVISVREMHVYLHVM